MTITELLPASLKLVTGEELGLDGSEIVLSVEGWDGGGSMRRSSTPRLNAHGEFFERGWRGSKALTVKGNAAFDTPAEAAQFVLKLEAVLADGTEGILTVVENDLGMTRWMKVALTSGVEISRSGTDVEFTFDLLASDPFKHGTEISSSAVSSGQSIELLNSGTVPSDPIFEVRGGISSGGGLTITEPTTGSVIGFSGYTVANGSVLRINAETGEAYVGSIDVTEFLNRREWTLVGGGETDTYTFSAPADATATLTGKVTPKWQ